MFGWSAVVSLPASPIGAGVSLDTRYSGDDVDVGPAVGGASDLLSSCVLALESEREFTEALYEQRALFSIHRRQPSFSPVHFTCATKAISTVTDGKAVKLPAVYRC